MTEDQIFREVEEDLRREQLKAIWNRFGLYIILAAASIVIFVGGQQAWKYWSQQQADTAGTAFSEAQQAASDSKPDEAKKAFEKLIQEGPEGYRILSLFQVAASQASSGKVEDAVKTYDQIVNDKAVDNILKDFARIHKSFLIVDKTEYAEVKNTLGSLATPSNPWRNSAREMIGLSAYSSGNVQEARSYYTEILQDREAPPSLRQRAQMMLSLIVGNETETQEKTGSTSDTKAKTGAEETDKSDKIEKKSSDSEQKPSK